MIQRPRMQATPITTILNLIWSILFVSCLVGGTHTLSAQELTPHRWNHLPINLNILGSGYVYTHADIVLDPVLQIENLELEMNTVAIRYIRTAKILGKSARFELGQGYQDGTWDGLLEGKPATVHRQGLTDTSLRVSAILYGAPPLEGKEFKAYRQSVAKCETLVGVGLIVNLPTGDYSSDHLINLGSNRFTFKPQLGLVHQRGHWTYEVSAAIWYFTDNDDFWKGSEREQDPFYTLQGHLIYTFRPGLWLSSSIGYGYGAQNTINGELKDDRGENLAFALVGGFAISRNMGFKLAYIGTRTQTNKGFDSDSVAVSFSVIW